MARAQNDARGRFQKQAVTLVDRSSNSTAVLTADSTGLVLSDGIKISNQANGVVTANSTGLVLVGAIKINNKQTLTGNSTGIVFGNPASSLPGNVDNGVLLGLLSNSTGVAVFVNSTGTTHKYLNVTTIQPT